MDKFVMMKKKDGTRVRTKDIWGVQIQGGKIISIATESRYAMVLCGLD